MHERAWGRDSYPNRPDLADILNANVVVFWQGVSKDDRWFITLHNDLNDLERYLARALLRLNVQPPNKRIMQIFQNGQRILITGIRVQFEPAPDE